ncbi:hypothetical protein ONZ45_g11574 [Pleurotus djamor]|nr:hypothetical protein ONZ45_g11574 [Pleurotus djamor]
MAKRSSSQSHSNAKSSSPSKRQRIVTPVALDFLAPTALTPQRSSQRLRRRSSFPSTERPRAPTSPAASTSIAALSPSPTATTKQKVPVTPFRPPPSSSTTPATPSPLRRSVRLGVCHSPKLTTPSKTSLSPPSAVGSSGRKGSKKSLVVKRHGSTLEKSNEGKRRKVDVVDVSSGSRGKWKGKAKAVGKVEGAPDHDEDVAPACTKSLSPSPLPSTSSRPINIVTTASSSTSAAPSTPPPTPSSSRNGILQALEMTLAAEDASGMARSTRSASKKRKELMMRMLDVGDGIASPLANLMGRGKGVHDPIDVSGHPSGTKSSSVPSTPTRLRTLTTLPSVNLTANINITTSTTIVTTSMPTPEPTGNTSADTTSSSMMTRSSELMKESPVPSTVARPALKLAIAPMLTPPSPIHLDLDMESPLSTPPSSPLWLDREHTQENRPSVADDIQVERAIADPEPLTSSIVGPSVSAVSTASSITSLASSPTPVVVPSSEPVLLHGPPSTSPTSPELASDGSGPSASEPTPAPILLAPVVTAEPSRDCVMSKSSPAPLMPAPPNVSRSVSPPLRLRELKFDDDDTNGVTSYQETQHIPHPVIVLEERIDSLPLSLAPSHDGGYYDETTGEYVPGAGLPQVGVENRDGRDEDGGAGYHMDVGGRSSEMGLDMTMNMAMNNGAELGGVNDMGGAMNMDNVDMIEKGDGVWKVACSWRVWEILRRYTPDTIRAVVAQQANDYYATHGMESNGFASTSNPDVSVSSNPPIANPATSSTTELTLGAKQKDKGTTSEGESLLLSGVIARKDRPIGDGERVSGGKWGGNGVYGDDGLAYMLGYDDDDDEDDDDEDEEEETDGDAGSSKDIVPHMATSSAPSSSSLVSSNNASASTSNATSPPSPTSSELSFHATSPSPAEPLLSSSFQSFPSSPTALHLPFPPPRLSTIRVDLLKSMDIDGFWGYEDDGRLGCCEKDEEEEESANVEAEEQKSGDQQSRDSTPNATSDGDARGESPTPSLKEKKRSPTRSTRTGNGWIGKGTPIDRLRRAEWGSLWNWNGSSPWKGKSTFLGNSSDGRSGRLGKGRRLGEEMDRMDGMGIGISGGIGLGGASTSMAMPSTSTFGNNSNLGGGGMAGGVGGWNDFFRSLDGTSSMSMMVDSPSPHSSLHPSPSPSPVNDTFPTSISTPLPTSFPNLSLAPVGSPPVSPSPSPTSFTPPTGSLGNSGLFISGPSSSSSMPFDMQQQQQLQQMQMQQTQYLQHQQHQQVYSMNSFGHNGFSIGNGGGSGDGMSMMGMPLNVNMNMHLGGLSGMNNGYTGGGMDSNGTMMNMHVPFGSGMSLSTSGSISAGNIGTINSFGSPPSPSSLTTSPPSNSISPTVGVPCSLPVPFNLPVPMNVGVGMGMGMFGVGLGMGMGIGMGMAAAGAMGVNQIAVPSSPTNQPNGMEMKPSSLQSPNQNLMQSVQSPSGTQHSVHTILQQVQVKQEGSSEIVPLGPDAAPEVGVTDTPTSDYHLLISVTYLDLHPPPYLPPKKVKSGFTRILAVFKRSTPESGVETREKALDIAKSIESASYVDAENIDSKTLVDLDVDESGSPKFPRNWSEMDNTEREQTRKLIILRGNRDLADKRIKEYIKECSNPRPATTIQKEPVVSVRIDVTPLDPHSPTYIPADPVRQQRPFPPYLLAHPSSVLNRVSDFLIVPYLFNWGIAWDHEMDDMAMKRRRLFKAVRKQAKKTKAGNQCSVCHRQL